MSDETIERIFNEIANKCGLLTQNHIAFLSSDNTAFRESLTTTGRFANVQYKLTWGVWVFVDYHSIHIQSKSRHTKTISGDYSFSQLEDAIEDITKFIKEIKLYRVKERIRDIDKDFITDEELINLNNYDTFSLFNKTI
jgi:hypothetical protein